MSARTDGQLQVLHLERLARAVLDLVRVRVRVRVGVGGRARARERGA